MGFFHKHFRLKKQSIKENRLIRFDGSEVPEPEYDEDSPEENADRQKLIDILQSKKDEPIGAALKESLLQALDGDAKVVGNEITNLGRQILADFTDDLDAGTKGRLRDVLPKDHSAVIELLMRQVALITGDEFEEKVRESEKPDYAKGLTDKQIQELGNWRAPRSSLQIGLTRSRFVSEPLPGRLVKLQRKTLTSKWEAVGEFTVEEARATSKANQRKIDREARRKKRKGMGALRTMAKWNRLGRGDFADGHFRSEAMRRKLGIPMGPKPGWSELAQAAHIARFTNRGHDVYMQGTSAYIPGNPAAAARYAKYGQYTRRIEGRKPKVDIAKKSADASRDLLYIAEKLGRAGIPKSQIYRNEGMISIGTFPKTNSLISVIPSVSDSGEVVYEVYDYMTGGMKPCKTEHQVTKHVMELFNGSKYQSYLNNTPGSPEEDVDPFKGKEDKPEGSEVPTRVANTQLGSVRSNIRAAKVLREDQMLIKDGVLSIRDDPENTPEIRVVPTFIKTPSGGKRLVYNVENLTDGTVTVSRSQRDAANRIVELVRELHPPAPPKKAPPPAPPPKKASPAPPKETEKLSPAEERVQFAQFLQQVLAENPSDEALVTAARVFFNKSNFKPIEGKIGDDFTAEFLKSFVAAYEASLPKKPKQYPDGVRPEVGKWIDTGDLDQITNLTPKEARYLVSKYKTAPVLNLEYLKKLDEATAKELLKFPGKVNFVNLDEESFQLYFALQKASEPKPKEAPEKIRDNVKQLIDNNELEKITDINTAEAQYLVGKFNKGVCDLGGLEKTPSTKTAIELAKFNGTVIHIGGTTFDANFANAIKEFDGDGLYLYINSSDLEADKAIAKFEGSKLGLPVRNPFTKESAEALTSVKREILYILEEVHFDAQTAKVLAEFDGQIVFLDDIDAVSQRLYDEAKAAKEAPAEKPLSEAEKKVATKLTTFTERVQHYIRTNGILASNTVKQNINIPSITIIIDGFPGEYTITFDKTADQIIGVTHTVPKGETSTLNIEELEKKFFKKPIDEKLTTEFLAAVFPKPKAAPDPALEAAKEKKRLSDLVASTKKAIDAKIFTASAAERQEYVDLDTIAVATKDNPTDYIFLDVDKKTEDIMQMTYQGIEIDISELDIEEDYPIQVNAVLDILLQTLQKEEKRQKVLKGLTENAVKPLPYTVLPRTLRKDTYIIDLIPSDDTVKKLYFYVDKKSEDITLVNYDFDTKAFNIDTDQSYELQVKQVMVLLGLLKGDAKNEDDVPLPDPKSSEKKKAVPSNESAAQRYSRHELDVYQSIDPKKYKLYENYNAGYLYLMEHATKDTVLRIFLNGKTDQVESIGAPVERISLDNIDATSSLGEQIKQALEEVSKAKKKSKKTTDKVDDKKPLPLIEQVQQQEEQAQERDIEVFETLLNITVPATVAKDAPLEKRQEAMQTFRRTIRQINRTLSRGDPERKASYLAILKENDLFPVFEKLGCHFDGKEFSLPEVTDIERQQFASVVESLDASKELILRKLVDNSKNIFDAYSVFLRRDGKYENVLHYTSGNTEIAEVSVYEQKVELKSDVVKDVTIEYEGKTMKDVLSIIEQFIKDSKEPSRLKNVATARENEQEALEEQREADRIKGLETSTHSGVPDIPREDIHALKTLGTDEYVVQVVKDRIATWITVDKKGNITFAVQIKDFKRKGLKIPTEGRYKDKVHELVYNPTFDDEPEEGDAEE